MKQTNKHEMPTTCKEDVQNEIKAAKRFLEKFKKLTLLKSPFNWPFDYVITQNEDMLGFLEIKCRKDEFKYPTVFFSEQKLKAHSVFTSMFASPVKLYYGLPIVFLVCNPFECRYAKIEKGESFKTRVLDQREKTGWEYDREIVCEIPMEKFVWLSPGLE